MTKERRSYTDDEIATALARLRANAGNAKRTAEQLGISRTTLRQWAGLSPVKGKQVPPEKVNEKGEQLAGTLEQISQRLGDKVLEALDRIEIKTATDVRNLLVGAGITTEKASFARGGPTSRTESMRISLVSPDALRSSGLTVIEGGRQSAPAVEKAV